MINAQTLHLIIFCFPLLCVSLCVEVDFVLFKAVMTHLHKCVTVHNIDYINQCKEQSI